MRDRSVRRKRGGSRKKKIIFFLVILIILFFVLAGIGAFFFVFPTQTGYISPLALHPGKLVASVTGEKAQQIKDLLSASHISYSKVTAEDLTTFTVVLSDKGEVIMTSQKDLGQQVASLQLIITRLTMEGKHFSRLDLRYTKPVIVLR